MKQEHILEALVNAIDEKIFKEWKHEGFIGGCSSEHIDVEIDGKEYVLRIDEVEEGEHWVEKIGNDVLCVGCEYLMFSDCGAVCSKGRKGVVNPKDSCGNGKKKGGKE